MINITSLMQVKAFARQDGALLALLWIASFASIVWMPQSMAGSLLAIATPFFVGWRLKKFRDYALEGLISFRRGYAYSVYTFIYAALLFALVQFLYFRYLDHGTFTAMIEGTIQVMIPVYEQSGVSVEELKSMLTTVRELSPVEWSFTFMMQNLFIGAVLSLPIAAIAVRRRLTTGGTGTPQQ